MGMPGNLARVCVVSELFVNVSYNKRVSTRAEGHTRSNNSRPRKEFSEFLVRTQGGGCDCLLAAVAKCKLVGLRGREENGSADDLWSLIPRVFNPVGVQKV